MTLTPERNAPESRGPSVSRRLRWGVLAALGFVIVPSVYAAAVLTPVGQRMEDAALGGVVNAGGERFGTLRLERALAVSSNTAFADLAVRMGASGVDDLTWLPGCTREDPSLYSYRRDGATGRFAGVIVRSAA